MADALKIEDVRKSFAGVEVLRGINLTIAPGEFFTLLGPSGCGKTTLLRIIAGFLKPDSGTATLGGERIDDKPAPKRDIGMVFKDYAVFPHLTVNDNIAFGLKQRGVGRDEIATRVAESLRMVRLDGLGERYPSEMSGGQQQRVGIARAMVIRPRLILMDEPLSNLDAKLRVELRDDIRALQKKLGVAAIYVTHDQEEALALSDRICVMYGGVAEQVGTPAEIYRSPARRFPAGFVGTMNFLKCEAKSGAIPLGDKVLKLANNVSEAVEVGIRPEHAQVLAGDSRPARPFIALDGAIERYTYLGTHALCVANTAAGQITAVIHDATADTLPDGTAIRLGLPLDRLFVYGRDGARIALEA